MKIASKLISRKSRSKSGLKRGKLGLGFALIILGLIFIFGRKNVRVIQSSSFESEPVKILGFSSEETDKIRLPKRIIIPTLNIDLEVKKGDFLATARILSIFK